MEADGGEEKGREGDEGSGRHMRGKEKEDGKKGRRHARVREGGGWEWAVAWGQAKGIRAQLTVPGIAEF